MSRRRQKLGPLAPWSPCGSIPLPPIEQDAQQTAFNADDAPPDKLRMVLGIEAATAREDQMGKRKTATTTATAEVKARKAKGEPKSKKAATEKTAKPKQDLVVFALRMTEAERTKLHDTAGPRGATRLARAVLIAAAREDESAFRSAIKEAREARA